jgi:predicted kinase
MHTPINTINTIELFHATVLHNPLFTAMRDTVENSLWHREDNVLVHTEMVIKEYIKFVNSDQWTIGDWCGYFAALFHDVGKPAARTERHNEERGVYFSYPGHEQISARLWEDWAVQNTDLLIRVGITTADFWKISWMIEHHLPYGTSKTDKISRLVETAVNMFPDIHQGYRVLTNVLLADQFGRISDNMEVNRQHVVDWTSDFNKKCEEFQITRHISDDAPTCFILIGASGSGKSTFLNNPKYRTESSAVYSWDTLRLRWYGDDSIEDPKEYYQAAFLASTEDSTFNTNSQKAFLELLVKKVDVFVDNTNISTKRRHFFIDAAKHKGYKVVAVLFPISIDELYVRHTNRLDKHVPWGTVKQMFMSIQMPSYGEFDEIETNNPITLG